MKLIYWNNRPEDRNDTSKPTILMLGFGADQVKEIEKLGGFKERNSGCYAIAESLPDTTIEDLLKDT